MKKVFLLLLLGGLFALVWHSTHGSLDPALLSRATQEYDARKEQLGNRKYVTIVDFRRDMLQPRLFVYNMQEHQVALTCRVSHAWGSGLLYATDFSNKVGSEKSCLGVFRTDQQIYVGKFGYALRVDGLSAGTNDKARARAVVIHEDPGYQWSKGCFMTSSAVNNRLISLIKGRSLLVVYR
jgi:hypothetical protein